MLCTMDQARADALLHVTTGTPVFFAGPPGVGKSDLAELVSQDWAIEINQPVAFKTIIASQMDAVDTRGVPVPDLVSGFTRWLVPDMFPRVDRDGEYGILNLDEITNAPLSVQAALYQLILARCLGDYVLPFHWQIIATGNRLTDRAAAQRMSTALANRFAIIEIEPDAKAWRGWATLHNVHPALIAFLAFRPELIYTPPGTDQFAFNTARSITRCDKLLKRVPALSDAQLRRGVTQNVGDAFATEFMAFYQIWKSLPPIKAILADPTGTPVPSEASLCYAVASALAGVVDASTLAHAMVYTKRLGAEYRGLMIDDAIARDATLTDCKAYIDYAIHIARTGDAS